MIERVTICPERFEVWCDAPMTRAQISLEDGTTSTGCDARVSRLTTTVDEAREIAKAEGWRGDGTGKCFCPRHEALAMAQGAGKP